jgi:hypothetical protein
MPAGVPLDVLVERQSQQMGLMSTQLMMRDIAMEKMQADLDKANARLAELEGDTDADATDEPTTETSEENTDDAPNQ